MHFYGVVDGQTKSVSRIYRTLKRAQLSRKTMTRIHVLRCNVEGLNFLNRIAPNDPINCVVVDGMAASPQAFYEKLGWAPIGEECSQQQIVIGTRQFSVLAAVSPIGFLCWQIFEDGVKHDNFVHFLQTKVKYCIGGNSWLVLDNAKIHHHDLSRIALEDVFNGNYHFNAKYSPHLSPIKTCFSMIKRYIRDHELEAQRDPCRFIDHTFEILMPGTGAMRHTARNHFNMYFSNHQQFLIEFG
jgi:transposase